MIFYKPFLFFTIILYFNSFNSNGCSCYGDKYLTIDTYNRASVIFSGKVVRVDTVDQMNRKIYFLKKKLYKGENTNDTIEVYSYLHSGMCGMSFRKDEEWLILTFSQQLFNGDENKKKIPVLYTNLCQRNCLLNDKQSTIQKIYLEYNLKLLNQILENPNFIFEQYYLTQKIISYDTSIVKLYAKGEFTNGYATGKWSYYKNDKSLKEEYYYSPKGMIQKIISYYPNGNIHNISTYDEYGNRDSYIIYNERGKATHRINNTEKTNGRRKKVYYISSGKPPVITF
jgi:hypothetical protein